MNNNIDIKTLEAFQDGNHKAFETIFIAYYNKTKTFIDEWEFPVQPTLHV